MSPSCGSSHFTLKLRELRILAEDARRPAEQHGVEEAVEILPLLDPHIGQRKPRDDDPAAADAALDDQAARAVHIAGLGVQLSARRPPSAARRQNRDLPQLLALRRRRRKRCRPVADRGRSENRRFSSSNSACSQLDRLRRFARQIRLEERALELVERAGPADDELPAPVQPVEQGLLLKLVSTAGSRSSQKT